MMDCVVPGGVAADMAQEGAQAIRHVLSDLASELPALRAVPAGLSGVGIVTASQAACFVAKAGDAEARALDRLAAIEEGHRRLHDLLRALPPEGPLSVPLPVESGEALGSAAGPGGDIWHWLSLDHGQIAGVFLCDPSWLKWPLFEAVMSGAQVEDLPLIMASFGLSSSGVDL
jgi:Ni,Fe-hydrogenase III large subunit